MDFALFQLRTTLLLFLPAPGLAPNSCVTAHIEIFPKQFKKVFSNCCKAQTRKKEFESHQSFIFYANDTFIFLRDDLGNSLITLKSCAIWNAVLTLQFCKDCPWDFWGWPEKLLSRFCHLSLQIVPFKEKQCRVLISYHTPVLSAFNNPYLFSYPHLHIQEEFYQQNNSLRLRENQ